MCTKIYELKLFAYRRIEYTSDSRLKCYKMDSFGYPLIPNFQSEGISNTAGGSIPNYEIDQHATSHGEENGGAHAGVDANARGRSDISTILDQIMNITDQVAKKYLL